VSRHHTEIPVSHETDTHARYRTGHGLARTICFPIHGHDGTETLAVSLTTEGGILVRLPPSVQASGYLATTAAALREILDQFDQKGSAV
jgi:hypothetical protein